MAVAKGRDAKLAAGWVIGDYFAFLNKSGADLDSAPVDAAKLGKELTPLHAEPLDAQVLFDAALATAKKAQKRVLIHFDAPW